MKFHYQNILTRASKEPFHFLCDYFTSYSLFYHSYPEEMFITQESSKGSVSRSYLQSWWLPQLTKVHKILTMAIVNFDKNISLKFDIIFVLGQCFIINTNSMLLKFETQIEISNKIEYSCIELLFESIKFYSFRIILCVANCCNE